MYCDLNLRKKGQSQNDPQFKQLLTSCIEDNYGAVAVNHIYRDVILQEKDKNNYQELSGDELEKSVAGSVNLQQFQTNRKIFNQHSRITLDLSELKNIHQIQDSNKILQSYDIIAVKPRNDRIFIQLCNEFDYFDIITFDCFDKLPFIPKRNIVKELIKKGIYFEINYSDAIQDQNRRRMFISNSMILIKATGGKNIIISSDCSNWLYHRSPYDLVALAITLGMKKDTAFEAINNNPSNVIKRAGHRKAYKGTISEANLEDIEHFQQQKQLKNQNQNNQNQIIKQLNTLRKKVKISKDLYKTIIQIKSNDDINIIKQQDILQKNDQFENHE